MGDIEESYDAAMKAVGCDVCSEPADGNCSQKTREILDCLVWAVGDLEQDKRELQENFEDKAWDMAIEIEGHRINNGEEEAESSAILKEYGIKWVTNVP